MAARIRAAERPALAGRLRRFAPAGGQALGAAVACALWAGLASPGLQLLPGLEGLADDSIAISLQSAVLGIDDRSGRPAEERAREAAAVLGLNFADELFSPTAVRVAGSAGASPAVVRLGAVFGAEVAPSSLPAPADRAAGSAAGSHVAAAPAAAPSSAPSATPAPAAPAAPRERAPAPVPATPAAPASAPDPPLGLQAIEFTSRAAAAVVGGAYDVSATATSGLPVKFSAAGNKGTCKISGSIVSFRQSGTCVVEAHQSGNARFKEAHAEQSILVSRAAQTIDFLSTPPTPAVAGGPPYVVTARASSSLQVELAVAGSSPGVCKLAGTAVLLLGAGTCTLEATQGGDGGFEPAPRVQQSFAIVKPAAASAQSIAFTSTPPSPALVGGVAYSVAATASSGLPVSFSATGESAGVCAVSGSAVTFVGEGTCVISASQAGNGAYLPASAQQAFAVERTPQALNFVTAPPATAVAGSTEYTVDAASSSGLPVTFSVAQSSAAVCAISGSTVTAIDSGTCVVEANQPGDDTYAAAAQIQQSFTIGSPAPSLSGQTITYTSTPPATAAFGGAAYTVAATASSGLPVVFSAAASSAGVCSLSGSTVTFVGVGTCTVDADQAGGSGYEPAPQTRQSFAVGRASQAISFASTPPVPAAVGGPDYDVAANASSGLTVGFAAAPASAGVCTVSGSTVSLVGAGTCTVVASQGGNGTYEPAAQVQQSFTVGAGAPTLSPQTISFTSTAPASAVVGGPAYTVVAAASSGLPVVFAAAAGSAGVCSVSGSAVSFTGAGTCTINADQPGSASYEPAPQAQQSFSVATPPPAQQTISFTSSAPGSAVYGGPAYTVSATATSGLAVAFSAAPSSAGVCTVSGSTVSIVGAGTCTVRANQSGNASYAPAAQVQQSFTVARATQTITITSTPPAEVDKRSPPYTITATASSGLTVTFTIAAGSADNCTISGSSISFKKKGNCVVNANQSGNANYLPAPQVQQTIVVVANA